MGKNNDRLNGLSGDAQAEILRLIWDGATYQICLADMVFDDHGAPVDYIIMDINPAYEKAFGFSKGQATNRYFTELFPNFAPAWVKKCGEAVRSGKNYRSVEHINDPCLWYEVQVFPLGSGGQFITMAQDITKLHVEKIRIENDITSNKIEYEALHEQVELLNVLMDYMPSLIFLKDEYGRYVYLNQTYEQQFVGSKNWYGKTDFDFWSKESAELFRANDLAVLETGQVTQYLEDSTDLNGKRYCWLNYKFPYIDSRNRRYSGGIGIDVTERIIAEEALRKVEEELQHYAEELKEQEEEALELIDSFSEGTWIVDCSKGTIKCSEKWAMRIGLDRVSEKERLPYTRTLVHPENQKSNTIEHCLETGLTRFDLEYRIKTVDRGYVWTQNRGKIKYDAKGKAVKVYAATIDITERKRAEEALQKSEERFRALVTASSDVIYSMSPDWKQMYYLQGKNFIGNSEENSNTWVETYIHPEDQPQVAEAINESIRTKTNFELLHRVLRTDDTLGWTFSRAVPLLEDEGEIVEWIGAASDVTERKQAEEIMKMKNEVLKKTIEMKDEFLSLISHELRTPLTVIISAIQMLKFFSWNESSDKAKRYFNTIQLNSNRQLKLVNNILDITKINAGIFDVHKTNSDIVQLTKLIIESIGPYTDHKKIKVSYMFTPANIVIGIDEEKYERVLLNLLSNAIKYTPKGESVTVKLSRKTVNHKIMACIQVSDTGIGIPTDKKEHIFQRFGQVDSGLSRQAEGTGIGLHLTRMFVEMLGGEISLESKLGEGSTFTVLIPAIKVKETLSECVDSKIADNRIIQLTEIEFSDIYLDK